MAEDSPDGNFEEVGTASKLLLTNNIATTVGGAKVRYIRVAVTPYSADNKYGDTKYSEANGRAYNRP